ncbi:AMP-dependent synthetase/ligase [Croceibacterium mercuriale]|uniref:AMP-dependent synthetase/ligase n=1 Tax=Croceibacterium mercuriale TaxID=1572751 RepID=UPI00068E9650|nr:long-chain fatty acid--CoA ligase [Croceibacterium mercuriale]
MKGALLQLADFPAASSLVRLFFDRADALRDAPFLGRKHGGTWTTLSWAEAADRVCLLAQALRELDLATGDRVLIVAENRPEWCIADIAIMAAGLVTTPAYITNTAADHAHILADSGARAVIVSGGKLLAPLLQAMRETGVAQHLVVMDGDLPDATAQPFAVHRWADLVDPGAPEDGRAAHARTAAELRQSGVGRTDLACIIYTSGTGGVPRGVMLSHGAILANVAGAATALVGDYGWHTERFLSFLPLSHAYEHTAGQWLPVGLGAEIWYAESLEKLAGNMAEASPTLMVVVPRLFEVLRARIIKQVAGQGKLAQRLMDQALALGTRQAAGTYRLGDKLLDLALDRTLRPKIRARFGGRIKALVSGGAPLNPEVGRFFQSLGLPLLQGYGQTEAAPVISCNYPSAGIAMETVGPPLQGNEVRVAPDGELLVRGELVMNGYWNNPEETAKALIDGWLHTGDIGHFDHRGRIVITDRKKDLIVNDKGDNVAPQRVEGMLTLQPEIAQAMLYGDRRPYMVALLVPDAEWLTERGITEPEAIRSVLDVAVSRVNASLGVVERIRRFTLADAPFAIDNGELTPSMKIRRHMIRARYEDRLGALYRS